MARRFALTRPEFAEFLNDPRKIREFERLFEAVSQHDATIVDVQLDGANANANAELALGLVDELRALVALLQTAPAQAPESAQDAIGPLPQPAPIPDELWAAALAPAPVPASRKRYGAFHSQVDQTPPALDTNVPMLFEVTDLSRGVYQTGDKFTVDTEGVYNVQFSVQLVADAAASVMIWPQVNGVNVPWANSLVTVQNSNDAKIPAWNWLLKLNAGDYVQIWWRSTTHLATLQTQAAADGYSAIPSVIVTVTECTGDTNHGGNP